MSDPEISSIDFFDVKLDVEATPHLETDFGPQRTPRYEGRAYEAPAGSWRARWVAEKKRYQEARAAGELDGFATSEDLAALQGTRVNPFTVLAALPELHVLGERAIGAARLLSVLVSLHELGRRGACVQREQLGDACALSEATAKRRMRGLIALGLVEQVCLLFRRHGARSSCCGAAYRVPVHVLDTVLGRIARDSVNPDLASGTDSDLEVGAAFGPRPTSPSMNTSCSVTPVHNPEPEIVGPTTATAAVVPASAAESCSAARTAPEGEHADRVTSIADVCAVLRESDDPNLRALADGVELDARRRALYVRKVGAS